MNELNELEKYLIAREQIREFYEDVVWVKLEKKIDELCEEIRNLNERLSGKTVTWQIRTQERRTAKKVLDKLKLKIGKDYDFKFISNTFALELLKKYENNIRSYVTKKVRVGRKQKKEKHKIVFFWPIRNMI